MIDFRHRFAVASVFRGKTDYFWTFSLQSTYVIWYGFLNICLSAFLLPDTISAQFQSCHTFEIFRIRIEHAARHFLLWFAFTCIVESVLVRPHVVYNTFIHTWSTTRVFIIPSTEGTYSTAALKSGTRHALWIAYRTSYIGLAIVLGANLINRIIPARD